MSDCRAAGLSPLLARVRPSSPGDGGAAPAPGAGQAAPRRPRGLFCLACGAFVAWPEAAIVVRESHAHHVFNPAGIVFHIGCFAEAPGVRAVGARTGRFSWFPGYVWCPTACGHCARHLGWHYVAEITVSPATFHALILDRVTESDGSGGQA